MNEVHREDYLKNRPQVCRMGLDLSSLWKDDWIDGDNVLDIGCGTGELVKHIASRDNIRCVVGIDISETAIDIANHNNSVMNKTRYAVADATRLQESCIEFKNSFTKVISMGALHWIEDIKQVFRKAYWCLRPSGLFNALFMMKDPQDTFTSVYYECCDLPRWKDYLENFKPGLFPYPGSLQDLNEMVNEIGFKVVSSSRESPKFKFESVAEHKGFLKPLLGHLDYIPFELHAEFMEDAYQLFCSLAPKDEAGKPYWWYEVVCLKIER
ncbi:juvenile hormone acid O-methyltransferase-like [Glandiceps talaboti]